MHHLILYLFFLSGCASYNLGSFFEESSMDIRPTSRYLIPSNHIPHLATTLKEWWTGELEVKLVKDLVIKNELIKKGSTIYYTYEGKILKIVSSSPIKNYDYKNNNIYCFNDGLTDKITFTYLIKKTSPCSFPKKVSRYSVPPKSFNNHKIIAVTLFHRTKYTKCESWITSVPIRDITIAGFKLPKEKSGFILDHGKPYAVYSEKVKLQNPFSSKNTSLGEVFCIHKKDQEYCMKPKPLGLFEIKRCNYNITSIDD